MRNPRDFAKPLAVGAPDPVLEIPVTPSRMIHFFDPSNEKIVGKLPDLATKADVLLGNLEDAIAVDNKEAAREGLVRVGKELDLGETALCTVLARARQARLRRSLSSLAHDERGADPDAPADPRPRRGLRSHARDA